VKTGKYKPYPEYADSGVEWIGELPVHWRNSRLKYLASTSGGGTPSKDNPSYWNGDIPWVSPKDMKGRCISKTIDNITEAALLNSSANLVQLGALLMVVRSGILQHSIPVAINQVPVTLNQDMKALRFEKRMKVEYAMFLVQGNQRRLLFEWLTQGATVESVGQELLENTILPCPPISEQVQICKFLDYETAKIDLLIEKQQSLIDLL
jgi:type I restriction enzyme S subunit